MEKVDKLKKLEQLKTALKKKKRKLRKLDSLKKAKEHVKKTVKEQKVVQLSNVDSSGDHSVSTKARSSRVRFSTTVQSPENHKTVKDRTSDGDESTAVFNTISQKRHSSPKLPNPPSKLEVGLLCRGIHSHSDAAQCHAEHHEQNRSTSKSILQSLTSQSQLHNSYESGCDLVRKDNIVYSGLLCSSDASNTMSLSVNAHLVKNSEVLLEESVVNSTHEEADTIEQISAARNKTLDLNDAIEPENEAFIITGTRQMQVLYGVEANNENEAQIAEFLPQRMHENSEYENCRKHQFAKQEGNNVDVKSLVNENKANSEMTPNSCSKRLAVDKTIKVSNLNTEINYSENVDILSSNCNADVEVVHSEPVQSKTELVEPKFIRSKTKPRKCEMQVLDFSFLEDENHDMYSQIKNRRRRHKAASLPSSFSFNFPRLNAGLSQVSNGNLVTSVSQATEKQTDGTTQKRPGDTLNALDTFEKDSQYIKENITAKMAIPEVSDGTKFKNMVDTVQIELSQSCSVKSNREDFPKYENGNIDVNKTKFDEQEFSEDLFQTQGNEENYGYDFNISIELEESSKSDTQPSLHSVFKFPHIPELRNVFKEFQLPKQYFDTKKCQTNTQLKLSNAFELSQVYKTDPNIMCNRQFLNSSNELETSDTETNCQTESQEVKKCDAGVKESTWIENSPVQQLGDLESKIKLDQIDLCDNTSHPKRKLSSSRGRRYRKKDRRKSAERVSCDASTCESDVTMDTSQSVDVGQTNASNTQSTGECKTNTSLIGPGQTSQPNQVSAVFELPGKIVCVDNGALVIGDETIGIVAMVTQTLLQVHTLDGHKICSAEAEMGETFLSVRCVEIDSCLIVVTQATNGVSMVINSVVFSSEDTRDMFVQCISLKQVERESVLLTSGASHLLVSHITGHCTVIYNQTFTYASDALNANSAPNAYDRGLLIDTTVLQTIHDALHSVCTVQGVDEAVIGVSRDKIHIWDRIAGSLLRSVDVNVQSYLCSAVYDEHGLVFAVLWREMAGDWCVLAVNPCTSQSCIIMTSQYTKSLGLVKEASCYEHLMCSLHSDGSAHAWNVDTAQHLYVIARGCNTDTHAVHTQHLDNVALNITTQIPKAISQGLNIGHDVNTYVQPLYTQYLHTDVSQVKAQNDEDRRAHNMDNNICSINVQNQDICSKTLNSSKIRSTHFNDHIECMDNLTVYKQSSNGSVCVTYVSMIDDRSIALVRDDKVFVYRLDTMCQL